MKLAMIYLQTNNFDFEIWAWFGLGAAYNVDCNLFHSLKGRERERDECTLVRLEAKLDWNWLAEETKAAQTNESDKTHFEPNNLHRR